MEKFRSKSCKDPDGFSYSSISISHGGPPHPQPTSMQDLRCYSANHSSYRRHHHQQETDSKASKNSGTGSSTGKGNNGGGGVVSKSWNFTDNPELQRKKRVASYKVYSVEGKMKGSIKKSLRWIKTSCSNVVYGSWW